METKPAIVKPGEDPKEQVGCCPRGLGMEREGRQASRQTGDSLVVRDGGRAVRRRGRGGAGRRAADRGRRKEAR